jgi:hypothetical protein
MSVLIDEFTQVVKIRKLGKEDIPDRFHCIVPISALKKVLAGKDRLGFSPCL